MTRKVYKGLTQTLHAALPLEVNAVSSCQCNRAGTFVCERLVSEKLMPAGACFVHPAAAAVGRGPRSRYLLAFLLELDDGYVWRIHITTCPLMPIVGLLLPDPS